MNAARKLVPVDTHCVEMRRLMNASSEDGLGIFGQSGMGVVSSIGDPVIPVIMVAFSDLDFLPEDNVAKVDRFLNEEGYKDEQFAVGSVADYFEHCSNGLFTPRFEVVAKVTLSNGYKYYAAHNGSASDARRGEAVREAVKLAEAQGVNFSKYEKDGYTPLISILHAGPGEQEDYGDDYGDFFWAHFSQTMVSASTTKFSSYLLTNETLRDFDNSGNVSAEKMTGIGTFCHEFSHALGLPDMYDVNGATGGNGHTPGFWDVMDYQFMYDGYRPMEYSGYERSMMGWADVVNLDPTHPSQRYSIYPLASGTDSKRILYRLVNPSNPNEYFLFENRQDNTFYQGAMLGNGMLAWHIDYLASAWASNAVNVNANLQRVSVVPADKTWQQNADINRRDEFGVRYTFTGDVFPGYAMVSTFDNSIGNYHTLDFNEKLGNILFEDGVVSFDFGTAGTVGVNMGTFDDESAEIHDILGRKISGTPTNGLYISNNKKIIIK